jgi:hypothetical protein
VNKYLPTVFHVGPNSEAFAWMFGKRSVLGEVHFIHVTTLRNLPERLSLTPRAVVILECSNSAEPYTQIIRYLPDATVVALTSWRKTALRLAEERVFDVVMEDEPGWRLLSALRNAIERSVFREFLLCDTSA